VNGICARFELQNNKTVVKRVEFDCSAEMMALGWGGGGTDVKVPNCQNS
jgi:hypothetical protein